jgi:hypothetical protein
MKLFRSARVPRSGREARTPRHPRPSRAVDAVPLDPALPAPGSRWNMLRQSGIGLVETDGGEPQVFVIQAVRPPNQASGDSTVEYVRPGERQPNRMNLAAFRTRFTPAP